MRRILVNNPDICVEIIADYGLTDIVAQGRLVRVLEDWCGSFPGYHLYYPSRRHISPAFALPMETLRYRG